MYTLIIENDKGKQLNLNKNYFTSIRGVTPPSASINVSKIAGVDGAQFNSANVNYRNIVLMISPFQPVEKNRIKLYEFLKIGKKVKLYFINGSRSVYSEGYIETIEGDLFQKSQMIQVSLICPDPYMKSAEEIVADISKKISLFDFPFAIEKEGIPLSSFNEYLIGQINNIGDVPTGLIIELKASGTVINPVIHDANTREKMELNFTMQTNDLIRINTNKGQTAIHLIRLGETTNIINSLNDGATWFIANAGVNFYTYTVDDGLDDLKVIIKANALYEGV